MRASIPALLALTVLALIADPALANKFETISGGVNGSFQLKRAFVEQMLLWGGLGFMVTSVLAIVVPHANPAFLNYANWRLSAIVLAVIGCVLLVSYLLL